MAKVLRTATPEEAARNQRELAERGKKEIAQMPKGTPEQFTAQCERLKAERKLMQD